MSKSHTKGMKVKPGLASQGTRWPFPGLKTRVVCMLSCVCRCSPPGSSVGGISQARRLELAAVASSRGPSRPRIAPMSPVAALSASRFFTTAPPQEALHSRYQLATISVVPNLFTTRDQFHERQFFYGLGVGGWFQDDSSTSHLLGTLFLI